MKRFAVVFAAVGGMAVGAGHAHAEDLKDYLKHPAPDAGVEKAPLAAPSWCAGQEKQTYEPGAVGRSLEVYRSQHYRDDLLKAAGYLCWGDPKDPVVQAGAQEILQYWMNAFNLSAKDASETLTARMNKDKLEDQQRALCDALTVSDEIQGEESAFMSARRLLFSCSGKTYSISDVLPYLDSSEIVPDAFVELAISSSAAHNMKTVSSDYRQKALVSYIIDQYDYEALDTNAALRELDQAPYKGNEFARVYILETLGAYKRDRALVDDELKKAIKDPDFKALLVDGPQKGIAAWNAAAAKYKDALARSNTLEHAAMGPSRKALAGCEPALRKDFLGLLKTLKHDTEPQLEKELSDSIVGGLLLKRLILCMAGDGDAMMSSVIDTHIDHVRITRGPRHAAFFAAVDALNKIKDDRERFPVNADNLPRYWGLGDIKERTGELQRKRAEDSFGYALSAESGVIASATKSGDYMKVTFAPDKHKMPKGECHATNHILTFDGNGNPIYDQECKFSGYVMVDFKPDPIEVPMAQAGGVKAGRLIDFVTARGSKKAERPAVPLRVFADKTGAKLAAWLGFEL